MHIILNCQIELTFSAMSYELGFAIFFMFLFIYLFIFLIVTVFNYVCVSAFEQGHLDPWRSKSALIIIIIIINIMNTVS